MDKWQVVGAVYLVVTVGIVLWSISTFVRAAGRAAHAIPPPRPMPSPSDITPANSAAEAFGSTPSSPEA